MPENRTGTVYEITSAGTWKSSGGKVYYKYKVVMTDGTKGDFSDSRYHHKSGLPFSVSSDVTYDFSDGQYPKMNNIELKDSSTQEDQPKTHASQNTEKVNYDIQLNMIRESCIQSACAIYQSCPEVTDIDVLKMANSFEHYILTGDLPNNSGT